jgi:UDP-glucose 4-epimerase
MSVASAHRAVIEAAAPFAGARVLITGGLGFLGSSLAIALAEAGAHVVIMDCMLPDHGANPHNIAPVRDRVQVTFSDVRDVNVTNYLVRGQDYIFHLAGQVDHVLSITDPYPDIDINIRGTATLMEAVKHHNPSARVIYTGTRGEYGEAVRLPVDEDAPTSPKGLMEISNLTAEKIIAMYAHVHGIPAVLLRLTNIYGPRGQMLHSRYGVVNWFVRLALEDKTISVFGDGRIRRDFLYVDDCIAAMLRAAVCPAAYGGIFNVATGQPTDFIALADTLVRAVGSGRWAFAPFTPERAAQEPGDFWADISKIRRVVGWEPHTPLEDGLRATAAYYREHGAHYWR